MKRIMKIVIGKIIYKCFAQYLPQSYLKINKPSHKLRSWCARMMFVKCGKNSGIDRKAVVSSRISMGDRSGIGRASRILGEVHIGDDVLMGPEVVIMTKNHHFMRKDLTIRQQGAAEEKPVYIGNDVWIGYRAMIMPGVHIGDGAVIGAGTVVRQDIPEYAVCSGGGISVIRFRELCKQERDW